MRHEDELQLGPAISPHCANGRHFQCQGWWWVKKDHIALTCMDPCHTGVGALTKGNSKKEAS